ncbi:MAG: hypothetical protein AB7E10_09700 [Burkholderiaceae bacterium]
MSAVSVDNFVEILRAPGAKPHGCVRRLGCIEMQQKRKSLKNQSSLGKTRAFSDGMQRQMPCCAASKKLCTSPTFCICQGPVLGRFCASCVRTFGLFSLFWHASA